MPLLTVSSRARASFLDTIGGVDARSFASSSVYDWRVSQHPLSGERFAFFNPWMLQL
jgi:hypothetical protein